MTHFALAAGRFCGTSTKSPDMLTQFSPPPSQTWPDNGRFASRPRGGNGNSAALSSIDGKPQNRKAEHRTVPIMHERPFVRAKGVTKCTRKRHKEGSKHGPKMLPSKAYVPTKQQLLLPITARFESSPPNFLFALMYT